MNAGGRQAALPPTLAPRLISRDAAAAYVCVSPHTFARMVHDGIMPAPRRLGPNRIAWDVRDLDAAVDRLPHEGVESDEDHTWSDVDATPAAALCRA